MEYTESDVLLDDNDDELDDAKLAPDDILDAGDALEWSEELASEGSKIPSVRFSLEKRRAIEDYLEQRKLREEFDYEFDIVTSENDGVTKGD